MCPPGPLLAFDHVSGSTRRLNPRSATLAPWMLPDQDPSTALFTPPTAPVEEAALLADITTATAGEADLGAILATVLDRLSHLIHLTGGSIAVVDDDCLVVRAAIGPFAAAALGQRLPRGRGRSWEIIEHLQPYLDNDLPGSGVHSLSDGRPGGICSYLAVPLQWRGRAFGILEVDSTERNAFREADRDLLLRVAIVLSGSIELARRYAAEVQFTRELEEAKQRLETLLERERAAHAEADRALAIRDEFLSIASHELKTPLTPLKAAAQLLSRLARQETLDADRLDRQLQTIVSQVDRLRDIVDDLLVSSEEGQGGGRFMARLPTTTSASGASAHVEQDNARPGRRRSQAHPPRRPLPQTQR